MGKTLLPVLVVILLIAAALTFTRVIGQDSEPSGAAEQGKSQ